MVSMYDRNGRFVLQRREGERERERGGKGKRGGGEGREREHPSNSVCHLLISIVWILHIIL